MVITQSQIEFSNIGQLEYDHIRKPNSSALELAAVLTVLT